MSICSEITRNVFDAIGPPRLEGEGRYKWRSSTDADLATDGWLIVVHPHQGYYNSANEGVELIG